MKIKKKTVIISSIAFVLVAAIVVIAVTASGSVPETVNTKADPTEPTVTVDDDTISVDAPDDEPTERDAETLAAIPDDGNALTITEAAAPVSAGGKTTATQGKAGKSAKPISQNTPTDSGSGSSGMIGNGDTGEYNCGTAGHHCDGPETHAYILNLELEGCPYCGSHSCQSFYAVDQWGNTCYTPSKCPKYNTHSDPVYYCQECGKACGDGRNGTCVQFVEACKCPNCGVWVESNTCHTCN